MTRPIQFSAPMVRAILAGCKTQTRRIVREPNEARLFCRKSIPERHFADPGLGDGPYLHWFYGSGDLDDDYVATRVRCPYGKAGGRLWIKETWRETASGTVYYLADEPDHVGAGWKSPRFMPRWASRITLELTSVRVERVQDISEDDARAEGVTLEPQHGLLNGKPASLAPMTYRLAFGWLWDAINGKRAPWASNAWVWVLEFRRLT